MADLLIRKRGVKRDSIETCLSQARVSPPVSRRRSSKSAILTRPRISAKYIPNTKQWSFKLVCSNLYNMALLTLLLLCILCPVFGFDDFQVSNFTDQFPNQNSTVLCEREHAYDNLDVEEILGKWNVREIYMHVSNEGPKEYPSCPVTTIWKTEGFPHTTFGPSTENQLFHVQHINAKFRQEYRHLRLLWDEAGQTIEYALYFRNDSAGYWQVFDGQNGTIPSRPSYQQFSGSVQVLKAVNDHLVLNFCQEAKNGRPAQLYSVLFSREPARMSRWELDSIHTLLQNKKLSVASRRMVCGNSADKPIYSLVLSFILITLTYAVSSA